MSRDRQPFRFRDMGAGAPTPMNCGTFSTSRTGRAGYDAWSRRAVFVVIVVLSVDDEDALPWGMFGYS